MSDILVADDGAIRTIRMNRPEKKNALTLAMYDTMAEAIEGAAARDDLHCLLIAGHETGFCAGNDIGDFVEMTKTGALGAPILRFLHALNRSEKPVVAAVAGRAVGVGTTMLLHCDHVVAAEHALLSTPFVALGLVPEAGSSMIAPRLMGRARAFTLLVLGRPLHRRVFSHRRRSGLHRAAPIRWRRLERRRGGALLYLRTPWRSIALVLG